MSKSRTVRCARCGQLFEAFSHNARWCGKCRPSWHHGTHVDALAYDNKRRRAEAITRRRARDKRLLARDAEYAKLDVPVTTHVAADGSIVEVRGQPRIGSCCGTLGGMSSEVARKYL